MPNESERMSDDNPTPPELPRSNRLDGAFDEDRAMRLVANLRGDIAKRDEKIDELKKDHADEVDGLKKQLADAQDNTELDQLKAEVGRLTSANAKLVALNALTIAADKHGADAEALTDSSSFEKKLLALDTNADDYGSQVDQLVSDSVENNPKFLRSQVAPQSGGGARPGGGQPASQSTDIEEIRKERLARRSGQ